MTNRLRTYRDEEGDLWREVEGRPDLLINIDNIQGDNPGMSYLRRKVEEIWGPLIELDEAVEATPELVTLKREHAQRIFDALVGSMDFGSGFLETDDVTALRALAEAIGVDPIDGTPSEFRSRYPHPFKQGYGDETQCYYSRCDKSADDPIHTQHAAEQEKQA